MVEYADVITVPALVAKRNDDEEENNQTGCRCQKEHEETEEGERESQHPSFVLMTKEKDSRGGESVSCVAMGKSLTAAVRLIFGEERHGNVRIGK